MEKSGVVDIMTRAQQKSRTVAAACTVRGQAYRGIMPKPSSSSNILSKVKPNFVLKLKLCN